ncbi:MAG: aspartate aminotransferase family protein [Deltaproteobacteria bacterium]|nr:aspartate aminotransferase family protein [Deltaproteobacteria bacterium]
MKLAAAGMGADALFEQMEGYRAHDMRWRSGRTFAYVYDAGEAVDAVARRAYLAFLGENAMDPTVFPSLMRFENELVAIGAAHLGGDPHEVAGSFTSGGTESIILAVKTARDRARVLHPQITKPELLLPVTAHAAFHKASHYLGLEPVTVPVDPQTFQVSPDAMRAAITDQTVMMVASAPGYGHGVIDPIAELGALALERDLLLHVDACVGGWLLPYFRRLGKDVPAFDFSVPGVTSMSMDLHKYAFCAKGASLVLYRDRALRRHQWYACSEWTGYTVVNSTVQSTKSGGPLAAAWAVVNFLGEDGYLELARQTVAGIDELLTGLRALDDFRVLGDPQFCMAAVTSETVGMFHVIDEMKRRGWYIQPQLSFQGSPTNIHFSIQPGNAGKVGAMLEDLRGAIEAVRDKPFGHITATIRQQFGELGAGDLDEAMFGRLLAVAGVQGVSLPERMAEINEVLDGLPRPVSRRLLIEFLNELYMPVR